MFIFFFPQYTNNYDQQDKTARQFADNFMNLLEIKILEWPLLFLDRDHWLKKKKVE